MSCAGVRPAFARMAGKSANQGTKSPSSDHCLSCSCACFDFGASQTGLLRYGDGNWPGACGSNSPGIGPLAPANRKQRPGAVRSSCSPAAARTYRPPIPLLSLIHHPTSPLRTIRSLRQTRAARPCWRGCLAAAVRRQRPARDRAAETNGASIPTTSTSAVICSETTSVPIPSPSCFNQPSTLPTAITPKASRAFARLWTDRVEINKKGFPEHL